jgi:S-DNA-T family DNA segregation ATPase FtsK/SpoIIIE
MTLIEDSKPISEANGHSVTILPPRAPMDGATSADARGARPRRAASATAAARRALRAVKTAATHRHTVTAVRQVAYVGAGGRHVIRRTWESRTTAVHDKMIRAAIAQGDNQAALEWEQRAAQFRKDRHERRMAMLAMPYHVAKGVVIGTGLTFAGLLALGIVLACSEKRIGEVVGPIEAAIEAIRWCVAVFRVTWLPALLASPVVALAVLYATGRRRAELPTWVQSPAQRAAGIDEVITPSSLVTALRDLGHGALRSKIKEMADAGAAMLGPIESAGCGVQVDVFLPQGVSTAEIQAKRQKLAENLGRHKHELFITIPPRARTVRLWIADSGALDEPIGPSPLVTDPTTKANYATGRAPWGQSLRGDRSTVSLFQRHILVTGISNQGKTASLRALILWLALDARVRLWLADFKGVGDWGMFKGIAEVLIEGPTDEHIIAGTHMADAGVAEMQKRTTLMQELTAKGWTQEKILADPRFAPLVLVFDEAQKAYGSGAVGEDKRPYGGKGNASRYFQAIKAIHDQGRAVNVTTAEGVQDPTNENLPVRTREGNHIRCSLVVGTESQAVMALGENAVNAGAAPHELRQGADKGTLVIAGDVTAFDAPRGQVFTTIRTHYIGADDAKAIAERAKARRTAVETKGAATEPEKRDVLADVAEVLGTDKRVGTEEVVHRLKVLAPDFYRDWSTPELTAALRDTPAAPYKTVGTMHVGLSRVREALEERENEPTDTETDAPGA